MEALLAAELPVVAVIANRSDAGGLAIAQARGVATRVVEHRAYASREAFDGALAEAIEAHRPDLIVLAGFMRVLTPAFVQRFANRMINIHPSLLPSFTGLDTHRRALDAGVKLHGCTVHFVTDALDHGPIIAQAAVPVLPDDTESTLAARVLAQEHRVLPAAVRWFLEGRLAIEGLRVRVDAAADQAAALRAPEPA